MMGEMETTRVEEQENYWLIQYQKLLDSKPKGLEEAEGSMDPKVMLMLILVIKIFLTFNFPPRLNSCLLSAVLRSLSLSLPRRRSISSPQGYSYAMGVFFNFFQTFHNEIIN